MSTLLYHPNTHALQWRRSRVRYDILLRASVFSIRLFCFVLAISSSKRYQQLPAKYRIPRKSDVGRNLQANSENSGVSRTTDSRTQTPFVCRDSSTSEVSRSTQSKTSSQQPTNSSTSGLDSGRCLSEEKFDRLADDSSQTNGISKSSSRFGSEDSLHSAPSMSVSSTLSSRSHSTEITRECSDALLSTPSELTPSSSTPSRSLSVNSRHLCFTPTVRVPAGSTHVDGSKYADRSRNGVAGTAAAQGILSSQIEDVTPTLASRLGPSSSTNLNTDSKSLAREKSTILIGSEFPLPDELTELSFSSSLASEASPPPPPQTPAPRPPSSPPLPSNLTSVDPVIEESMSVSSWEVDALGSIPSASSLEGFNDLSRNQSPSIDFTLGSPPSPTPLVTPGVSRSSLRTSSQNSMRPSISIDTIQERSPAVKALLGNTPLTPLATLCGSEIIVPGQMSGSSFPIANGGETSISVYTV